MDIIDDILPEVPEWLADAHSIAARNAEPRTPTGSQCSCPFTCPFIHHCRSTEPQPDFPISCLPNFRKKATLEEMQITELRDVPDDMLNPRQQRVKNHTLAGETYFDAEGAASAIASFYTPADPDARNTTSYFLDFETTMMAVPIWKGTRPYQQIPFQFSLHTLHPGEELEQHTFLALSGNDPRRAFAEDLIARCGSTGPIFVYNASFERRIIREQAQAFPDLAARLDAISARIADLLPVARNHYYHPSQNGSWSIKAVLPAICPDLNYGDLDGVQDGNAAMQAYQQAIHPDTPDERKKELHTQLDQYCAFDTIALVRLWEFFSGR